jgi:hypothetical protein
MKERMKVKRNETEYITSPKFFKISEKKHLITSFGKTENSSYSVGLLL